MKCLLIYSKVHLNSKSGSIADVTLAAASKTINDLASKYLKTLLINYRFTEFDKATKLICFLDAFKCPHGQVCVYSFSLTSDGSFIPFIWFRR